MTACNTQTLLFIDDDADLLLAMRMHFRNRYEVFTATSIAEGIRVLREQRVDLVLMDMDLNGESGLDGVQQIYCLNPAPPVAMLSGRRDEEIVSAALRMGAIAYLTKPLRDEELDTTINTIIP